jgi:hypothetical protein
LTLLLQVAFPKIRDIQLAQGYPEDTYSGWNPGRRVEAPPPAAVRAQYIVASSAMAIVSQAKLRFVMGLPMQVCSLHVFGYVFVLFTDQISCFDAGIFSILCACP